MPMLFLNDPPVFNKVAHLAHSPNHCIQEQHRSLLVDGLQSMIYLQDKILQSGGMNDSIQVTNDGATILRSIGVDNPAAKVLIGECPLFFTSAPIWL